MDIIRTILKNDLQYFCKGLILPFLKKKKKKKEKQLHRSGREQAKSELTEQQAENRLTARNRKCSFR